MRQLPKKLTALLAAASLCLAAPVGALADTPSVLYTFAEEYQAALSEPLEITTFDDDGTAAAATVTETGDSKEVTEEGYYTVTIPATVSVSDTSKDATFTLSGKLQPYRELKITVSTGTKDEKGNDCLKCGSATLPYTLSAESSDDSLTIDNGSKKYSAESNATEKDFSANLSVKLADDANPSVSGEYTDTLTFTMDCKKKKYTVVYNGNGADGAMDNSNFNCGEDATLAENKYTKTGYKFAGWSTQKDPATFDDLYADKADVKALTTDADKKVTLYAQWGHEYKVVVRYEGVEDNFADAETKTDFDKVLKEGSTFTWNCATADANPKKWQTVAALSKTVGKEDETFDVKVLRQQYRVDLNGYAVDEAGKRIGGANIDGFARANVWVNDELVSGPNGVIDYFAWQRYGSTFRAELIDGSITEGYVCENVVYTTSETINGTIYGILKGANYKTDSTDPYYYDSVTFVFKKNSTTGTDSTETIAEQSLTITDTMRDYFADLYPEDETADTDAAEDAEDTTATPETAPDDGYDSYDDYVVDEYPVVFFETE